MLQFKKITIDDRDTIKKYTRFENSRSADYNFGNMYMWDSRYNQQFAEVDDRLVDFTVTEGTPFFAFPIGKGDIKPAINEMKAYAGENGFPLQIRGVEKKHIELLDSAYPGDFEYTQDRPYFDYIYSADSLLTLSGRKLHGKRNHINRFLSEYDWSFEPLERAHFGECIALLHHWENEADEAGEVFLEEEHSAISRSFEHFEALELLGGALFVDGRLIAFSMGEIACGDTFDVHFEKARWEINGAYQMINQSLVKLVLQKYPQVKFFNREDDMGFPNIRTAKMSYHPECLLEKHTARLKVT